MKSVDSTLFDRNVRVQSDLWIVASRYQKMRDARWMFAFAHFRITQQINDAIRRRAFRDPDQLIRFNISFATAFLAAVAGKATPPWRKAFDICEGAVAAAMSTLPGCDWQMIPPPACEAATSVDPLPVIVCATAMADAHINTDIVNALKTIGCIDAHDYGNMLLFVERGARDAIYHLTGTVLGPVFNALKRSLLPLDRKWRNAVYANTCQMPVPLVEQSFRDAVERNTNAMMNIRPSVH